MSMPGKQARVLCPVCQEPIPPDETECGNCGAFVIDEAVVRLSRAFGLDRERALKLFDAGFRHPKQLRDRDPNRVLEKGEVGLLFICTNCGGFVASADTKCPRCAAEFETEAEGPEAEEEDILDLVLCPACGADNDPDLAECEICGEALREGPAPTPVAAAKPAVAAPAPIIPAKVLEKVDDFIAETERPTVPDIRKIPREEPPAAIPRPIPKTPASSAISPKRVPPAMPTPIPSSLPVPPKPATVPKPMPTQPTSIRSPPPGPRAAPIEPAKVPLPSGPSPGAPSPPTAPHPRNRPVRRKVRPTPPSTPGFPAETIGGLVLAAAAGLLLAGALNQHLVAGGIAAILGGLAAYQMMAFRRGKIARPPSSDGLLLMAGILCGLVAATFRDLSLILATTLALVPAFPFAWATRVLLRTPQRSLIAVGTALPLIGQGLVAALDPAYRLTIPWIVGILASIPWPAALTATEIQRRQSTTVLQRQVIRAERGIQRKDYEQSLAEYDRAIAKASNDVPGAEIPWYGKGATLILLGRYEEALRAIDTALDINPRNEVAWVNKGNALTRMGRLMDALRCFNAAIKVNPRFEVAWNNKGNALARLGKFEEALRCYDRCLKIDPGYRGAWVNMGFVLTKLGRFEEAASCADHALVLDRRGSAGPA